MAKLMTALMAAALAVGGAAQGTFTPAKPPAVPLAVRSPYLNTWLRSGSNGGDGGILAGEWPVFWQGAITGWGGIVRVDGTSYTWMGQPKAPDFLPSVNQTAFEYTATRSVFHQSVGDAVSMKVTFLSPVNPDDYLRMSLPFSYMEVEVTSLDGASHEVQLYTDISAEWVSGDRSNIAQWDYGVIASPGTPNNSSASAAHQPQIPQGEQKIGTKKDYQGWRSAVAHSNPVVSAAASTPGATKSQSHIATPTAQAKVKADAGGIAYHKVYRQTQELFAETSDQTEYGNYYYLADNTAELTHQSGADVDVRQGFVNDGCLTNAADTNYRAINDNYPVFAFAYNLGQVSTDAQTALFGISLAQEQSIQFLGADGVQPQQTLWKDYFSDDLAAISWFYNDYSDVSGLATTFDSKVHDDSVAAAGDDYATITALVARQAFGALQLTGTKDAPLMWMKEISSDGNVNTVDVIFPAHPVLLYTNPQLLKALLEPLFINQEAGNWPQAFTIHDIGSHYPNATGHPDGNAEQQPLEECGNMIIMALAYAQRANDNDWLTSHYKILKSWVEYLVEEALIPADQISTDDFAGSLANQTNLAIKGIIGIQAMAQIADRTGNADDKANYTSIAQDYITKWQGYGINKDASPPHTTLSYGNDSSWGLLYNIYSDRSLGLGLVPQSVYDMQSTFYPTVFNKYGVPLDTRHAYTKTDWELFVASVASPDTRDMFIKAIRTWLDGTPTSLPCTDLYDTETADFAQGVTFINRPVVGGYFALLSLAGAPQAPSS